MADVKTCVIYSRAVLSHTDSSSLLKLWDMIHSYERLMELKNSHCELLTRKLENMENRASGVQREQTEIKSWLPHRGGEWEDLCTLRHGILFGFLIKIFIFMLYVYVCVPTCASVYHMHAVPPGARRGRASDCLDLELQMTEPLSEGLQPNPGPVQEQPVFFSTEPFLQPCDTLVLKKQLSRHIVL